MFVCEVRDRGFAHFQHILHHWANDMRTYFDCIPCFLRQALDSVRLITQDEAVQQEVLRKTLRAASEMNFSDPPPAMGRRVHRIIRACTGNTDPYAAVKARSTEFALELLPEMEQRVRESKTPLSTALKLSIAGNIIDFGVKGDVGHDEVKRSMEKAFHAGLDIATVAEFQSAFQRAERILFLADNAGEVVFDRPLLKLLPMERIMYVVRGAPVINDATLADAQAAGIHELVEVMDNGSDAPGTLLSSCGRSFLDIYQKADLVIAKGQGNYETLSGENKQIFFLLQAKCPIISRSLGCPQGTFVFRKGVPFIL